MGIIQCRKDGIAGQFSQRFVPLLFHFRLANSQNRNFAHDCNPFSGGSSKIIVENTVKSYQATGKSRPGGVKYNSRLNA
jgi:hypothetical protein